MNKRIIITGISVLTLSVSGAILYWTAPKAFSNTIAGDKAPKKKTASLRVTHNDDLKADFIKIVEYYKAPILSFVQTITQYFGDEEATEKQTLNIYKGTNYYLSEGPEQIMICNERVSVLIDKPGRIIYFDSAWDFNALMPYTDNMLELLGNFEKIEKKQLDNGWVQYTIPSNITGVDYTLLTTDSSTGQIQEMEIVGTYQTLEGVEKEGKTVFSYSGYNLTDTISTEKLNENNFIKREGTTLTASNSYEGFRVISKKNIYER